MSDAISNVETPLSLTGYFAAMSTIDGWFQPDAALMFFAYNQLIAQQGVSGHVLEIGVHHGKSSIATAAMRGENSRFVAIDLFELLQSANISNSGSGNRRIFLENMRKFHPDLEFLQTIATRSSDLKPADLGPGFSFCHIDGGHSAEETYHDMALCSEILKPGGLLALDDYFHSGFPGVSEGAIRFMLERKEVLIPLAIGFNKVLFQKAPAGRDTNVDFGNTFPYIPKHPVTLWSKPAALFRTGWLQFVDVSRSNPSEIQPSTVQVLNAFIEPESMRHNVARGTQFQVPTRVVNRCNTVFVPRDFALSYHLLADGHMVRFDNGRTPFATAVLPGTGQNVNLNVVAPDAPGEYSIEIDVVWEGVTWLKDRESPTALVTIVVE